MVGLLRAGFAAAGCLLFMQQAVAETACSRSAGPAQARRLVEQCLNVSPATHPPCNAANTCALIEDEIRRGCTFLGSDAPAFCTPYRQPG